MKKIQYDDYNGVFVFFSRLPRLSVRHLCAISLVWLGLLSTADAWGQTLYRSAQSGNWNATTTWEVSINGGAWVAAVATPTSGNSDGITIRSTYMVTVTANVTIDQTTIESGGQVNVNSGQVLTIANGTGTDLTVDGILRNTGSVSLSGGNITFNSGGTYIHDQNGGTIPTATWDANSNCNITGMTANYPSGMGQTFGNVTFQSNLSGNVSMNSNLTCDGNLTMSNTGSNLRFNNSNNNYTISVGGDFSMTNGNFFILNSNGNGTMNVTGNFSISLGTFNMKSGNGTAELNVTGNFIQTGGTFSIRSNGNSTSTLTVEGDFSLTAGTFNVCDANNSVGTLNVAGDFSHTGGTMTETANGSGQVNFNGTSTQTCSVSGTISNTINFAIATGSIVSFGSTVLSGSDGIFNNSGTIMGTGPITPPTGGTGALINNGTVAPGNSIGTLTINGNFTNGAGGTLAIELSDVSGVSDVLAITGTAALADTLTMTHGTTGTIDQNDTYNIITYASRTNNFGTFNYADGDPAHWTLTNGTTTYTVTYTFATALPIQLISFTGERIDEVIELNWRTASEENNDYMAVERSSDAFHFTEIGRVDGAGTTTETQDYSLLDTDPLPGINYYRLRQVDMDGRMEYFPVIAIDFVDASQSTSLEVFPNPASEKMRVSWAADEKENTVLRVFNAEGKLMRTYDVFGDNGTYELPLQQLAAGTYLLQVNHGKKTETIRFIKK